MYLLEWQTEDATCVFMFIKYECSTWWEKREKFGDVLDEEKVILSWKMN